jgi:3-hydroxyacyl-CoA dehydrogenase
MTNILSLLQGWYDYDKNIGQGRKALPSKDVDEIIRRYAKSPAAPFSDQQIVERILYPLVNEGFKILEEGIANQPSDIDVVYMYGYGWPVYRGGPMYWADHEVGLPKLLARLQQFHIQFPDTDYYKPSNLLETCVKMNVTVGKFYAMGLHKKTATSRL